MSMAKYAPTDIEKMYELLSEENKQRVKEKIEELRSKELGK